MKTTHLDTLLGLFVVLIAGPHWGKKHLPILFDRFWVQECFLVVAALIASFGVYFGLKNHFARRDTRRFVGFVFFTALYFSWIFIACLGLHRTHHATALLWDDSTMHKVVERALSANSVAARRAAAAQYYRAYGTAIVFAGSDGELEILDPTAEDIKGREEWLETERSYRQTIDLMKGTEFTTRLNLGVFTLTFLAGLTLASLSSRVTGRESNKPTGGDVQ